MTFRLANRASGLLAAILFATGSGSTGCSDSTPCCNGRRLTECECATSAHSCKIIAPQKLPDGGLFCGPWMPFDGGTRDAFPVTTCRDPGSCDADIDTPATSSADVGADDRPRSEEVRGFWVLANELHAFQPCGSSELIWTNLQGPEPGLDMIGDVQRTSPACRPDAGSPQSCTIYVEMTVVISAPGRHGHLGRYERSLDIVRVKRASDVVPADCSRPPPRYPR